VLRLTTADGVRLRGAVWEGAGRGLALLLPGRTEFLEKVAITAAALAARGFDVASLDWRGQGLSERRARPQEKGHVGDFAEYLADLAALLRAPEVAALGLPKLVVGHSMGAAIALEARAAGLLPDAPTILSAPMLAIRLAGPARAALGASTALARRAGRLEAWPPVPAARRSYPLAARFEGNVLTGDRAVWNWLGAVLRAEPRLGLGLPTLGWMAAAEAAMARIAAMAPPQGPGLVLLGTEERVVDPAAAALGAERLRYRLARIEGARHEPLIEAPGPRAAAWAALDAFLDGAG
jgi:lysophospholipase